MNGEPPRRWMHRFLAIWTGQQLSVIGSRAGQFALVWWLTLETGSVSVLATASLVAMIPRIVLGPIAGAAADRWNRQTMMILADSFVALAGLWLAWLFWSDAMQIWHIYVLMLARAIGGAFHGPAMAASTALMVPSRHYTRISGLNNTLQGLLDLVGAPLGALLLSVMTLDGIMLIDVATAAFAILPLLILRIPQPKTENVSSLRSRSLLSNTREGLRFVLGWRGLMIFLGGIWILQVATMPALSLLPLLVRTHYGGGATEYSMFSVAIGLGMVLGGLALTIWGGFSRKVHTILLGFSGVGLSTFLLGFVPGQFLWIGLVLIFVTGLMIPMVNGPIGAVVQATVPHEMQGRVFGLLGSVSALTTPIGLGVIALLGDAIRVPVLFVVVGVTHFIVICGLVLSSSFRNLENRTSTEEGSSL